MQRNTLYLTLAAVALTACSSSVPESEAMEEKLVPVGMHFTTEAMTATRAGTLGSMSDDVLQDVGAGVFAYFTGSTPWATAAATARPNFMYNQWVDYDPTAREWQYTPLKYWPNDNQPADDEGAQGSVANSYVSFFAYAPYVASPLTPGASETGVIGFSANDATGAPHVTYRLSASGTQQVDLLWGTRGKTSYAQASGETNVADLSAGNVVNTDLTKQTTTERVDFLFKHALACVDIYVQRVYDEVSPSGKAPAEESTRIYVSRLALEVASDGLAVEGQLNLATGEFDQGLGRNTDAFAVVIDSTRIRSDLVGSQLPNSYLTEVRGMELNDFASHEGVNATLQRLTNETFATMFIPVAGEAVTVTPSVTYSFVTEDDALEHGLTNTTATHRYARILHSGIAGSAVTIGTEYDEGGVKKYRLEAGKRYVLVCYIGVESVQYEVVGIEDWDFPLRFVPEVDPFTNPYNETTGEGGNPKTVSEN
ncbi:MAG: hypothetical protein IJ142_02765 [Bacteroidaceae bacterium]|nr:hypothetical protein [Bacteroidaceae bacterium]